MQRLRSGREHGRGAAAAEAVAAVPARFRGRDCRIRRVVDSVRVRCVGRVRPGTGRCGPLGQAGGLAQSGDDSADGLRSEASVAAGSGRKRRPGEPVRPQWIGVPAAGGRADVAPAVDAGEQRAGSDSARGQEGRPPQDRTHRADRFVGGVVDPAEQSPGGLVGLRRADRHRDALVGHELDVAEVQSREFGAAGEEGEAEQHDGAVTESGRGLVVACRDDRRQVRGHDRDGLARTVAAVARCLPALRGDDDLTRGQRVGHRRPDAAVHRPDRREVRVDGSGLQSALGRQVG
jgi:hypothetical protein